MSISLKINSGDDEPFVVEIEKFPTVVLLDKALPPFSLLPFGIFVLVFIFFTFGWETALLVGAILAGLLLFVFMRQGRKSRMVFEKTGVMITESGLWKDSYWDAAYSDFVSVQMRRRQAKSGRTQSVYQIIELKHPNSAKTLPLFVDKTNVAPQERWQAYGTVFDLPVNRQGY